MELNTNTEYSITAIDETWTAVDRATLVFVVQQPQVLLIRKKRGLGAGKINGPGGKLEPGESSVECAIREVQEELGITIKDPQSVGRLRFQFTDHYSIDVQVYLSHEYVGQPVETGEAEPLWFDIESIPYNEMWEDDAIWLPQVLGGQAVNGRFVFQDDRMLEHDVVFT